jgi:hypothetical protein
MDTDQIYTVSPCNQTTVSGLGGQDTITLSSVTAPVYHTDTIDLSMLGAVGSGNLTSPYTATTGMTGGFTVGTGWTGTTGNTPWLSQTSASTKINLAGENADIVVNGESLMATLSIIKERLNYLQVNPELEAEWVQLRELGEQYRKLEQHIRDKQATWDRLQAMPPPETT